ncbi:hypothetical protein Cob_v006620 [Colletotrichum orbiculare MAFF 240422]|uniref:Uncharacterized protein n=1 Tax=Colletotrichum orbiculare (strain 104-T / ATCC 96160 / CBS 514.97 / LARS 414 / MAFF 240422) TaxID=1213857 RepID=A0A484FUL3_COLOR|nr:hypothetical protein Cob_v006620 [Colletotrichum orbiculare MAFF 240422]
MTTSTLGTEVESVKSRRKSRATKSDWAGRCWHGAMYKLRNGEGTSSSLCGKDWIFTELARKCHAHVYSPVETHRQADSTRLDRTGLDSTQAGEATSLTRRPQNPTMTGLRDLHLVLDNGHCVPRVLALDNEQPHTRTLMRIKRRVHHVEEQKEAQVRLILKVSSGRDIVKSSDAT